MSRRVCELIFAVATAPYRNLTRLSLISFWGYLCHAGLATHNVAKSLPTAKERAPLAKPISEEQLKQLLEATRKPNRYGNPLKWECLITVLAGTGIRISEARTLRWDAMGHKRIENTVRYTKADLRGVDEAIERLDVWRPKQADHQEPPHEAEVPAMPAPAESAGPQRVPP